MPIIPLPQRATAAAQHHDAAMMRSTRLALLLALMLCAAGALWQLGSPRLLFKVSSPQGVYSLEFYSASFAQRLVHRDWAMPGFYRLHRIAPAQLMAEGPVVNLLLNSKITWPPAKPDALSLQLYVQGLEHIPPECSPACAVDAPRSPAPSTAQ